MAGAPKVKFESLFHVFEFWGGSGSVGVVPGDKKLHSNYYGSHESPKGPCTAQKCNAARNHGIPLLDRCCECAAVDAVVVNCMKGALSLCCFTLVVLEDATPEKTFQTETSTPRSGLSGPFGHLNANRRT